MTLTTADLRAARLKRGLSQEALARAAGVSRTYITTLEKTQVPPQIIAALEAIDNAGEVLPASAPTKP